MPTAKDQPIVKTRISVMLTRSVYVGLDEDIDATNTIQLYFVILVVSPVAELD